MQKKIAISPEIGTSNWGFAISVASILSFFNFFSNLNSWKILCTIN